MGEEAGLGQWRQALAMAGHPDGWTVHAPQRVLDEVFAGPDDRGRTLPASSRDVRSSTSRSSCASTSALTSTNGSMGCSPTIAAGPTTYAARGRERRRTLSQLAERLEAQAYHLRMTRDLEPARAYLRSRYGEAPDARFGLVASSRDKALEGWGVPNGWHETTRVQLGRGMATVNTTAATRAATCAIASPSSAPRAWSSTACCSPGGPTWCATAALVERPGQASRPVGARARPLPAAPQRLPRAAHPRARLRHHLRAADERARRDGRVAAGVRRQSAR